MKYWQIAAGSREHEYYDDFLRFGMAFVGGDENVAMMEKVEVGDRVILKRGMKEVLAVGEVVERNGRHRGKDDKDWLKDFDGWNLRAYCFVDWHIPNKLVHTLGLTRTTIQNVHKQNLKKLAEKVLSTCPGSDKLKA
ncbi:MAG: hypothetical protein IH946_07615, partial [Bacteroidetes bacterium]|nr:hypothetical protein [Bacteroidota bacterium]